MVIGPLYVPKTINLCADGEPIIINGGTTTFLDFAYWRDGLSAVQAIEARDQKSAERIREASAHWLRHTYGSHASARGVPQDVLQSNLGHESLATTSIYLKAEKGRRHRAMQEAFGARQPLAGTD